MSATANAKPDQAHVRAEYQRLRAQIQHATQARSVPIEVPYLPNWTPIAELTRLAPPNRWAHVQGAPIHLHDAIRMRDRGLLLMSNRREGQITLIVVKTPSRQVRP